jgi:hypothetical protein
LPNVIYSTAREGVDLQAPITSTTKAAVVWVTKVSREKIEIKWEWRVGRRARKVKETDGESEKEERDTYCNLQTS